ncbi:hypothetical protein MO867_22005, partial [Microbulbifer sp. OS29]
RYRVWGHEQLHNLNYSLFKLIYMGQPWLAPLFVKDEIRTSQSIPNKYFIKIIIRLINDILYHASLRY